MPELILLNKPYGVICQFSQHELHRTLKDYVQEPGFYPAGRLDTDSEGLLLLTNDGTLQHRISDPRWKLPKTYWVQVEGTPSDAQLTQLQSGVDLGDFVTRPAECARLDPPAIWPRMPPIRVRKSVPDSWISLTISEGKNRQVRRMTAKVGLPTLRLVRVAIGPWRLDGLAPGEMRRLQISLEDLPRVKHAVGINKPAGATRRPARHGRGGGERRG
ncbi:MAG: pseudouridine synthase [Paludibacterium sp.]|uniref:pseudouridine synthase n=1 Tax=Paludibacterium sp. TaxID=1917523 RepID=UPI0025F5DACD|nr:pseudouridine synthase [Paludibacterium sp.]MBV8047692.1 pseudouridine synthase [Paludibacterium sp.]MBV8649199.1 pseudouridine synthase [Paludibacterium sp.]